MTTSTFAAVILAAGKGSRMRSRLPKALHRVCGKPMASIAADAALAAGADSLAAVVPQDSARLRAALGARFAFSVQREPLGSGHALLQARDAAAGHDAVLALNCDMPLVESDTLARLRDAHAQADSPMTILTASGVRADAFGRVVRDADGRVLRIVERRDADAQTLALGEVNAGAYFFSAEWLWENLAQLAPSASGEIYLTDLAALAARQGCAVASAQVGREEEALGVNTREELARAEAAMRDRIRRRWMREGVSMPDPASVYIDCDAQIGMDTTILPNTHIRGATAIGEDCEIGPNSVLEDSRVGDRCRVTASVIESATLEDGVQAGPFSHIRAGSHLESEVYIGNFGEIKNSRIGRGSKSGHFGYIGDAVLGTNVNVGAGSVTCNYDGRAKHATTIGDDAFIGSDTMIVAPRRIGDRAYTGTGSVVTRDVPDGYGAVGAPARILPPKSTKRRRGDDDADSPPPKSTRANGPAVER